MTSLGEIVLKFGATGAEDESPLRFQAAHINLLVGPNNAGKSLMLRELSGVNPRATRRSAWDAKEYAPTLIVEAVDWDSEGAKELRQQIVTAVFAANEPAWSELSSRTWDELLPALDQAVPQFTEIRDQLCQTLIELAGPYIESATFAEFKEIAANFVRSDTKSAAPVVIGGAIALLQMTRIAPIVVDPGQSETTNPVSIRRTGPLTPEQETAILDACEAARGRCEAVFTSLGINTSELSLTELLDKNSFGGALLVEMAKNPILRLLLAREPKLLESVKPSAEALERVRRFMALGEWVLDPEPLTTLATQLRSSYADETWSNHERRTQLAKSVVYLDGMARLGVTRSAELKKFDDDEKDDEQPAILSLLKNPESMEVLRTLTADAIGGYLTLDMTSRAPKVIWRLAQAEPPKGLENTFSGDAARFHKASARLDERSDGIHAFVGMLAAMIAKPIDLVFIDEPEAFLHPPLVRKLARQLSWLATAGEKQIFIATHSADLLETFVARGAVVNIIRLTHDNERSTARLLNSSDLRYLARDPLLRSETTLSALFHEGAVICEAAGDRVLYKEINERLLASEEDDDEGLDSCVFLNAQNWGTIPRMMAPLRRMGVAAAAILDADVLFEPGLTLMLDAAQVDRVIRDGWLKQRDGLRDKISKRTGIAIEQAEDPKNKKKKLQLKGKIIAELTRGEKKIFADLCSSMAKYGVFIVPVGELEDWFAPLGLKPPPDDTKKARWLREALDRLGQDPECENYVRPDKGDIWDFMRRVSAWIGDPEREGTSPTQQSSD